MADLSPDHMQALLIHDTRFSLDTLNAKADPATATSSEYTQRGPRQGVPEPSASERMTLEASGGQSGDGEIKVTCQRAGLPNGHGASYVMQDVGNGDSSSEQYGHDGWQALTGYTHLINSDGTTVNSQMIPHAITLDDGKVLAIVEALTATTLLNFKLYDPDDANGTWTTYTHTHGGNSTQKGACLLQLPNGDILCFIAALGGDQIDVLRSTDSGENWATAAERVLGAAVANADIRRIAAAYSRGQIAMLVSHHDGAAFEATQYASYDFGASFVEVDTTFSSTSSNNDEVASPTVIGRRAGGFVCAWSDEQGASPVYRACVLGNAASRVASQSNVTLATGGTNDQRGVSLFESEIAEVWAVVHDGSSNAGDISLKRSDDGGETFSSYAPVFNFVNPTTGAELFHYTAAQAGGRVVVLGKFKGVGNSYANWSTVCCYLGGYSRHTLPAADSSDSFGPTDYLSWGTNADDEPAWLPFTEPNNLGGWALTNSGTNSYSDDAESGAISTTTGTRYYAFDWERTNDGLLAEFAVAVSSGGSTASAAVAVQLAISDGTSGGAGTYTYIVQVRLSTTGWQLYDVNAAGNVGSAVSKAITTKLHFRVALDDAGNVRVWTAADGYLRKWVENVTGSGLTNTAAAHGNQFRFGHIASATAESDWYMAAVSRNSTGKYTPASSNGPAAGWTNPDDLRGRDFTNLPHLAFDSVRIGAHGGPSWIGDGWTIAAEYDAPVDNLLTNESPSPSEPWESVSDNVEVLFTFDIEPDFTNAQSLCANFAAMMFNTNVREFQIQSYNGSTWSTIATAYAYTDFDSLSYSRTGRVVSVDTGTTQTAARFIFREAHTGDTFDFQDGTPTLRKIKGHSGGAWTDSTTSRPEILFDGADGTEPSSGTGRIWRRDFGIIYANAIGSAQQVRVRIPPHETVDGYYRIGTLIMGPLVLFGKPSDRGWVRSLTSNVDIRTRRDGVRRAQEQGDMRESFEIAWVSDFDDLTGLQKDDPVPDYIGNNGSPTSTHRGTTRDVMGAYRELGGPLHPCVYIGRVDKLSGASTQALTMPDAYAYVRVMTETLRAENVVGTESKDEAERLNVVLLEQEL